MGKLYRQNGIFYIKLRAGGITVVSKGVVICGLNGSGKSKLGKELAKKMKFNFIDNEDLYFPKTNEKCPYAASRNRQEVKELLLKEVNTHGNFIFTAVKGDYGEELYPFFKYIVIVEVPKEIRMKRVMNRSYQKFGNRMLQGGDLYEQEKEFFRFVESRTEDIVEKWVQTLDCPVIRIDGTKPVDENIEIIMGQITI